MLSWNRKLITPKFLFYTCVKVCSLLVISSCTCAITNISKEFVGVVFSPHVKSTGNVWDWTNYTVSEVETMLEIVSTKFKNISTYGVGATEVGVTKWNIGEAVGFTGIVAANLNSKLKKTAISVCIAIWRHDDSRLDTEIEKAFEIAKKANSIHPGTVWGITFSSNYVINEPTASQVVQMIENERHRAEEKPLRNVKFGVRLEVCEMLVNREVNSTFLHKILKKSDYVLCIIFSPMTPGRQGVSKSVEYLTRLFLEIKEAVKRVNKDIQVIFESGWPSKGMDRHLLPASIENLSQFWDLMAKSAATNKFHLNLFEAFDAPWKSDISSNRLAFNGPCGAEGHFGWWRRINDSLTSASAYVEKINEKQIPLCQDVNKLALPEESGSMYIYVSIAVFVLVALICGLVLIWYKKSKTKKTDTLMEESIKCFENGFGEEEDDSNVELALRVPYDRRYEKDRSQFKIYTKKILGRGQFGIVYQGKIGDTNDEIALKTTKAFCSPENVINLLSEIKLMIYIGTHPNIVGFIGACTDGIREGQRILLAMEFCSKGSLEKVLRTLALSTEKCYYANITNEGNEDKCKNAGYANLNIFAISNQQQENLPVNMKCDDTLMHNLITWCYHIAKGMEYLTAKKVIHADLATRNILLTENEVAKITDFGLSRKMYAYANYAKEKNDEPLPWRWMAIETLQRLSFSPASDVWSYGITMWEIFSLGEIPYPGLLWDIGFLYRLKNGLRLGKPKYATDEIYDEMQNCWIEPPQERPTFNDLVEFFENILNQIGVKTNEFESEP